MRLAMLGSDYNYSFAPAYVQANGRGYITGRDTGVSQLLGADAEKKAENKAKERGLNIDTIFEVGDKLLTHGKDYLTIALDNAKGDPKKQQEIQLAVDYANDKSGGNNFQMPMTPLYVAGGVAVAAMLLLAFTSRRR